MTNQNTLATIEKELNSPVTHSIIWLHGLGADGSDFFPLIPELKLPNNIHLRFIFPSAPVIPVTINNGYKMPAWFDILGIDRSSQLDEAGIAKSRTAIEQLIEKEIARGIPPERIIIAGFSQGAVMALIIGLCHRQKLAGIIALSGFLPGVDTLLQQASPANSHIPILMAHGTQDGVVPIFLGEMAFRALETAGYPIEWHAYPMQHSVCADEMNAISQWLQVICTNS